MSRYPREVTERLQSTPEQMAAAWIGPARSATARVEVVESDPLWPDWFSRVEFGIRAALGAGALAVEHVGSTAVPGLAAKPILDVDLTVSDTSDEASYVPALEAIGYELVVREPEWHGHRMFNDRAATVNLHVFPEGAPELTRHLLFRDWLRTHPRDRELYESAKRQLADAPADYNLGKNPVIDAIYARIFADDR